MMNATQSKTEPLSYAIGRTVVYTKEGKLVKFAVKKLFNLQGKAVVWNNIYDTYGEALEEVLGLALAKNT